MDVTEVSDTLIAANIYLNRLKLLDNDLENAVKQITTTFDETKNNIQKSFANLKDLFISILNKREKSLLDEAEKIKNEAVIPLEECRFIILDKTHTTNKLINLGNSIVNGCKDHLDDFSKNASLLGSLPEIPELKEVPFISFQCDSSNEIEMKNILLRFGEVSRIAPIQINELTEKPGAILVEWQTVDSDERTMDIQEFRLQRAFGDVTRDKHLIVNFKDCYRGLDTQFLVKDLYPGQPYSFRVCCKFEGTVEWSPWSLSQVFTTTLKSFSWQTNTNFIISSEDKIAKSLNNTPTVLRSDGPQFLPGYSIEFTFLDVEKDTKDALVGLLLENIGHTITNLNCVGEGSFLIAQNGKIFVDGTEKSTVLPIFSKGLKVCFTCDSVSNQKVRINIDSSDKRVTYDWNVDPSSRMFFVAQFPSSNWKIMVE